MHLPEKKTIENYYYSACFHAYADCFFADEITAAAADWLENSITYDRKVDAVWDVSIIVTLARSVTRKEKVHWIAEA